MADDRTSLLDLPDEVLQRIVGYLAVSNGPRLGYSSLRNIGLVCKRLLHLADEVLYEAVQLDSQQHLNLFLFLSDNCKRRTSTTHFRGGALVTFNTIRWLHVGGLTSRSLGWCSFYGFSVTDLTLEDISLKFSIVDVCLKHFPRLRHLSLIDILHRNNSVQGDQCDSPLLLESLRIVSFHGHHMIIPRLLAASCGTLRKLDLTIDSHRIVDNSIRPIRAFLPHAKALKTLIVSSNGDFDWNHILSNLPSRLDVLRVRNLASYRSPWTMQHLHCFLHFQSGVVSTLRALSKLPPPLRPISVELVADGPFSNQPDFTAIVASANSTANERTLNATILQDCRDLDRQLVDEINTLRKSGVQVID